MEKATREQTKVHNTRLVLKTIYQQGDTSRADIARVTNLTRTTVSDIVSELIETGLLVETGIGSSAGGKPPILLKVEENARQLVCLDLSAYPFQGALVNLRGVICKRASAEVENGSRKPGEQDLGRGERELQAVQRLVDELSGQAEAPLIGIGIGIPGLTDPEKGLVRRSVHLQWNELPVKDLLQQRYHLPVYLSNDSHAAALAEYTFGELRGSPNLIVVRVGDGIGAGILLSGQMHYGDGYGAGEIGHLTVVDGGRLCSCGNYGCLETVASPPAIVQRMRELAEYDWISFSRKGAAQPRDIDWEFTLRAFQNGDETVTELIKEAGRYLGVSIANLVSILNVGHIVVAGRYSEFGDTFLDAVRSEVRRRSLLTMADETQIVNSTLGPDIIILGVSALVLSKEMGLP